MADLAKADKGALQALFDNPQMKASIAAMLPRHLTPERMFKAVMVAASRNPKLYECTKESLAKAIMTASELGLDPSGTLGEGYLIPFFNGKTKRTECQFLAGYQGLVGLCRRSGMIRSIEARNVYENDDFSIDYGRDPQVMHRPLTIGERGKRIGAYAMAYLKDTDRPVVEWMRADELNAIRGRSRAGDSGPWVTDTGEMERKTVLRRLIKYLPKSTELIQAMEADFDSLAEPVSVTAGPPAPGRRRMALGRRIEIEAPAPVGGNGGDSGGEMSEEEIAETLAAAEARAEREPGEDG